MAETVTNLDTYVNGIKVVSNNQDTVTLVHGVTIKKKNCKYISTDLYVGATYYRYIEEDL